MDKADGKRARPRRRKGSTDSRPDGFERMNVNAAGIDIGSEEHWVSVPVDRDKQPVRRFGAFTGDLNALADWLIECGIDTVAMESTGSFWIPLFQILESRGLRVVLANTRHVRYAPRRKSDVLDCQWIQYLHNMGMLTPSFRPGADICVIRTLLGHRDNLVRDAASHVQCAQKALTEMNLLLHKVISDITGVTGRRILGAILEGERDPLRLAQLKDHRIKSNVATIAKALEGDWRDEQIFVLAQALDAYDHLHDLIEKCDEQVASVLVTLPQRSDCAEAPPSTKKSGHRTPQRNAPKNDLRSLLFRATGADLTQVPGIDVTVFLVLVSEIGIDLGRWPNAKCFASWLGLCPNPEKTGGRSKGERNRRVINRAAQALRMAANSLRSSQSYLGAFYRRLRGRLGPRHAIKALAHKLALIVYRILKTGQSYQELGGEAYEQRHKDRATAALRRKAKELGLQLIPLASVSGPPNLTAGT